MPRRLVVDSSVIAKFYLVDEEYAERAHQVLLGYAAGELELLAPFAVLYEVPGSIRKAVLKKRITWAQARSLVNEFISLPLPLVNPDPATTRQIVRRAFQVAEELDRSFYDAVFVAFAEMLGVPFLTADEALARAADAVVDAIFLAEFELE